MPAFRIFIFSLLFSVFAYAECINFGVIPYGNIRLIQEEYQKLAEWLKNSQGVCVDVSVQKNYDETIRLLGEKKLDCARVGPFSYALAAQIASVEPIVVGAKKNNEATYKTILLADKKIAEKLALKKPLHGIDGMRQLVSLLQKDARRYLVGFSDTSSTSGYLVPTYYLSKAGIQSDEYFGKTLFLGTHEAVQLSVKNKILSLGFSNDKTYSKLISEKKLSEKEVAVLWVSDPIPDSPIICRDDLDERQKYSLKTSLIQAPKEYIPNYGGAVKYIETSAKNYEIIRQLQRFVEKNNLKLPE